MDKIVLREDKDRVCTLTLNRLETLNALNMPPSWSCADMLKRLALKSIMFLHHLERRR